MAPLPGMEFFDKIMDPPPPNEQAYHGHIPYIRNPYYPSQPQPSYSHPQYYHNYHFPYPPSFHYSPPPPPTYYHEQAYVTQHFQPQRYPTSEILPHYPQMHFDKPKHQNSEIFASCDPTTRSTRPLSPGSHQTTLEQCLNDFIRETREENARLKETITKEMLGEIQELRHETLSPLQTVESTFAKIMEMIQSQGETDVNTVTLRSGRALPDVVPPPPQPAPTKESKVDNEETTNSTQAKQTIEEELRKEEMQPQPSRKGKEIMQEPPPVPKAKLPFP
ncbi:cyclic AMP-responsive element-binding protein 5-like [Ipomoea triloba]|uniref:cyclic AMP-responsive element-binding protein 5-like n=1 Tax=Ipomoea triloba TaxID=35885 RepID=UPI00125D4D0E|nr:cyclic AMP-responsive element-binding protein 5-like [Ipomoea triloba]